MRSLLLPFATALLVAAAPLGRAADVVADDFDGPQLDLSVWTFVDPLGRGRYTQSDGRLSIRVPAGRAHDLWTTGNNTPRLMQWVQDPDFHVEVKFDSYVSETFQMQGLIAQQDDGRFVRIEFHHEASGPRVYAAVIDEAAVSIQANRPFEGAAAPMYLRLARDGATWTASYSADGEAWLTVGTFSHAMTVNGIGVYAGNYGIGNRPVPGHTAIIDYFSLR